MAQPSNDRHTFPPDLDQQVVLLPNRFEACVPTGLQAKSVKHPAAGPSARVRTHPLRQVVVLEFAGRLIDLVADLDKAVQLALADGPRAVVCDLSGVLDGSELGALDALAKAGRHVRDWPGIPVAVACPDPRTRQALRVHPLGGHLIVKASVPLAISAVLATAIPVVEWRRLAPHPTAPRASRDFIARTLLDWGMGRLIPSASLVVSELVTNSTIDAGTDVELSVAWYLGALRLTVRDNSPDLPRQRFSRFDQNGRGLSAVSGLSRSFGVLPTAENGKVVWAVLYAARPRPSTSPRREPPATTKQRLIPRSLPKVENP